MKSLAIKVMLVFMALGGAILSLGGTANAVHVLAEISIPGEVTVGQPADIQVTLRSADEVAPVADIPVTFYADASFGGVAGEVELGTAMTDENGIAVLNYLPRTAGDQEVRVEYGLPSETEPGVATASFPVVGDPQVQLHRSSAGVEIPGLNVWLIIAVVSTVWAILFSVGLRVIAIARAGNDIETVPERAVPGQAEAHAAASRSGGAGAS